MSQEMPTIDHFNQMNFDEKAWHVWHKATFLIVRNSRNYRVNLYYLNGFYIQLWYHITRNKIDRISATESPRVVDTFLKMIELDLDGIMNSN